MNQIIIFSEISGQRIAEKQLRIMGSNPQPYDHEWTPFSGPFSITIIGPEVKRPIHEPRIRIVL